MRCLISILPSILGIKNLAEIPHYDTINDFLEKLPPSELENIIYFMAKKLIASKKFDHTRVTERKNSPKPLQKHYWNIAIDATTLFTFAKKHDRAYLETNHSNGATSYSVKVLEAKLVFGDLVFSIATEFIENEDPDTPKQDGELNAFYRMEKKLKERFKRLPICLLADSLYPSEGFFNICEKNGWKFICRFKPGKIRSVWEKYCRFESEEWVEIPHETGNGEDAVNWVEGIFYRHHQLTMLCMITDLGEEDSTPFTYLTNLKIDRHNALDTALAGRRRWKIENQGFDHQKNHFGFIEHANSYNYNAQKNHYLLTQIAGSIHSLYASGCEYFITARTSLQKKSSLLLECLRGHQLTEKDLGHIDNYICKLCI